MCFFIFCSFFFSFQSVFCLFPCFYQYLVGHVICMHLVVKIDSLVHSFACSYLLAWDKFSTLVFSVFALPWLSEHISK